MTKQQLITNLSNLLNQLEKTTVRPNAEVLILGSLEQCNSVWGLATEREDGSGDRIYICNDSRKRAI